MDVPKARSDTTEFAATPAPQVFYYRSVSMGGRLLSKTEFLSVQLVLDRGGFGTMRFFVEYHGRGRLSDKALLFSSVLYSATRFLGRGPARAIVIDVGVSSNIGMGSFCGDFEDQCVSSRGSL